jgi:chromosome partitioning protein
MSMKVISISTLKGGEGKSSIAILLARFIASQGKKTLVVDLDPQNSTSFHFVKHEDQRNIAMAIFKGNIESNIIQEVLPLLDICQSDLSLFKLRSMPTGGLKTLLAPIKNKYEYCIIDTAPTWDNIVISALRACDLVLLPARLKSLFSIKTAKFYRELIVEEVPEVLEKMAIFYNFYKDDNEARQFIEQYEKLHHQFFESHLPKTESQMKSAIDYEDSVSDMKKWDVLYPFLQSLYFEITEYFSPGNSNIQEVLPA